MLTLDCLAQLVRYTLNLVKCKWTITVSFLKQTIPNQISFINHFLHYRYSKLQQYT